MLKAFSVCLSFNNVWLSPVLLPGLVVQKQQMKESLSCLLFQGLAPFGRCWRQSRSTMNRAVQFETSVTCYQTTRRQYPIRQPSSWESENSPRREMSKRVVGTYLWCQRAPLGKRCPSLRHTCTQRHLFRLQADLSAPLGHQPTPWKTTHSP